MNKSRTPPGSPPGATRDVEDYLTDLAALYRQLADYLDASADALREIRLKSASLQKALGKNASLFNYAKEMHVRPLAQGKVIRMTRTKK